MAMTINEMLEKRARLWESTKKFLEDHIDKDGKMAAADAEAYEKMEADIKEMSRPRWTRSSHCRLPVR